MNGPNRIYYLNKNGEKKYVSQGGIGCYCDTEHSANKLETLIDEYNKKAIDELNALGSELINKIKNI